MLASKCQFNLRAVVVTLRANYGRKFGGRHSGPSSRMSNDFDMDDLEDDHDGDDESTAVAIERASQLEQIFDTEDPETWSDANRYGYSSRSEQAGCP